MKTLIYICLFFRSLLIIAKVSHFEMNKKYLCISALNLISIGLLLKLLSFL